MEPIIVIVGFLGAGKTTILKKLTKDFIDNNWNPYIILNDYQNANLDAQQFLDRLRPQQLKALNGSCICCSGVSELRQSVNDIPARERGGTPIEANGTTDACSLMGFLGVGLRGDFLPPIQISVVDVRFWQKRGYHNELEANQVQVSSLIILNFVKQVDNERLKKIKQEISILNPAATIKNLENIDALSLPELSPSKNHSSPFDHFKSHWSSCSIDLPDPMRTEQLAYVLANLPKSILRVKGCTRLDNDKHYSFIEKTPNCEATIRSYTGNLITGPKLLVIGPGSDPDILNQLINQEKPYAI